MALLQAALAGGYILMIFYVPYLIIGTMILSSFFMKTYWKFINKRHYIIDGKPYYKDPFAYITSVIASIFILNLIFYYTLSFLGKTFNIFLFG